MAGGRLAACAASFWVGIALAGARESIELLVAGAVVPAVFALRAPRDPARTVAPQWSVTVVLVIAFTLLGAGWGGLRLNRTLSSSLAGLVGHRVWVTGALSSDPQADGYGWSAQLRTEVVRDSSASPGMAIQVRDRLWIQGDGPAPSARRGDRVALEGLVRATKGDFGAHLRRIGFPATLAVQEVRRLGGPTNPLARAASVVRSSLRRSLERTLPEREAGLVMGLLLGDSSKLHPEIEEDFRATGLSHLTAASGQNLAMFLAPLLGFLAILGLGRWWTFGVGVGAILFFAMLTGGEPSVLRAAAMAGLTLLGVFLGRPRSPLAIMGGAVLCLLALDPTLVHSVGFQLSVGATAGIALLAGPISARLHRLPGGVALALGATLGAQAGVSPLILFYFGVVPLVTLPANLLAVPAVGPGMLLGLAAGAVGLLVPILGGALGLLARLPLEYLQAVADRLARSPIASVTSTTGQVGGLVLGVALVAAVGWWLRTGRRMTRPAVLGVALALPLFVWVIAVRAGPPSTLLVTFFDVGQGDAALVRSPGGASILIDGGPDPDVVAVKLASLGIRRIDLMVATHPHADHVDGLPRVLARFRVGLILDPGCEIDAPSFQPVLRAGEAAGVPFRHPTAGSIWMVGDIRLDVLGPDRCFEGTASDTNNDSIVLRLSLGQAAVLFTGDAEEPSQTELLEDHAAQLAAQVLKVPHHGGDTSLEGFFPVARADLAIVSTGPNRYGHPVQELLDVLAAQGMAVYRTDLAGEVTVTLQGGGVLVETER